MSEEIKEIFEQWKQFLSWCYENNDKTTEIHRDDLEKVMAYTRQLENIIKEVRDFVESMEYCGQEDYFYDLKAKDECGNDNTFNDSKYKLLEILDKESE